MSYQRQAVLRARRPGEWHALGADEAPLPPTPAPGSPDEQTALLRRIAASHDRFVKQEERLRYIQIGAILAVPLAGAVWRLLLGKRNVPSSI